MPKRKSKFTKELQQKYPCFRKGRDEFEAECITYGYGAFVSVANKSKLSLDMHEDSSKQGCESGSGSAKNPPLPLPHRMEEWREKRNWFCYPS